MVASYCNTEYSILSSDKAGLLLRVPDANENTLFIHLMSFVPIILRHLCLLHQVKVTKCRGHAFASFPVVNLARLLSIDIKEHPVVFSRKPRVRANIFWSLAKLVLVLQVSYWQFRL